MIMKTVKPILAILILSYVSMIIGMNFAFAESTPAAKNAKVYIIWPYNGSVIKGGKLWVRMGLKNAGVAPAAIEFPNTGHHHLLVNTDLPPLDEEIPNDKNHLHFGGGQTEARLELPPGEHTLQMLLADHDHRPHNPPIYSKKIIFIRR